MANIEIEPQSLAATFLHFSDLFLLLSCSHRTGAAPMGAALPPPPAVLQIDAAQGPPTPPSQSVYPPFTPYAQAGPSAPPPPPARTPQEAAEQNVSLYPALCMG
jgi:hypothetical protein